MAQSKIVVDTNSYFRLAQSVHPLLFVEFGPQPYCLYVLPELDDELVSSTALQTKFSWALEAEFKLNRRRHPTLSRKQKAEVDDAYEFIWEHVQTSLPGPSRVDARHLAFGYVLNIPVVTDDRDMRELARVFSINTMVSLELLKLMVDCEHIAAKKVHDIYQYWVYWKDLPYNAAVAYERLFGSGGVNEVATTA